MTFQKLIDEYGRSGDVETMEYLTRKVDHFVEEVREYHPELVERFLIWVDITLNPHFTKESSKQVVSEMINKDGTKGGHWDKETTDRVLNSKGYGFNPCDWYVALNMIYSDYYKSGRSDETYIELAYDFLADKDAPKDKMKRYYRAMHY